MEFDYEELKDFCQGAAKALESRLENKRSEMEEMEMMLMAVKQCSALVNENVRLKTLVEELQTENEAINEKIKAKDETIKQQKEEMASLKLMADESKKMMSGLAKKSDEVSFVDGMRLFINQSKRKTVQKREIVKQLVLEQVTVAKVTLPDDLRETLATFDDDLLRPTNNITISGNATYVENQTNKKA